MVRTSIMTGTSQTLINIKLWKEAFWHWPQEEEEAVSSSNDIYL